MRPGIEKAGAQKPTVTVLGGGHGLATTIAAARQYAGAITAVVSVADDGGSSGRLRQIAGIPAPGDLRRCLVAMAADGSPWAEAFEYRFPSGDLQGHALGNLVIAGLTNATGEFGRALDLASDLLGTVGRVLPATSVPVVLKADSGGTEIFGQVKVAAAGRIRAISVVPADAPAPHEALEAIGSADQVVLGPGSLFTSVLAVGVVPAIRATLGSRNGGRVYVCNLRPQQPETAGFGPADHVRAVLDHGVEIDTVVISGPGSVGRGPAANGSGNGSANVGDAFHSDELVLEDGMMCGVRTVVAAIARPDGTGHDPRRLAAVLEQLT